MKYWRGYLVAAIFAAISIALTTFAKTHPVLVDMIYPYVSRLVITSLTQMNAGGTCVWQVALIVMVLLFIASIVLMLFLRWNPIQWFGWVAAAISCMVMLHTGLYGLNAHCSPLADDMHLQVTDYTVSELNEAAVYFRDKANALALQVARDDKGNPDFGTFEEMAQQAGNGFENLTYEKAIPVFSGSTVPVKKQFFFAVKGNSGITVPLTGESAVNPRVPEVSMPFAISKEMAHRMCIYSDADADFTAFLAGVNNDSPAFQYSAYVMAYHYCYEALSSVPTSTAKACAEQTHSGVNQLLRNDLADCDKFYGKTKASDKVRTTDAPVTAEESVVTFSEYSCVTDLLASWYIQEYILPIHREEDAPFNPKDPTQVDLTSSATEAAA